MAGNNFIFNAYKKNQANTDNNTDEKDLKIIRNSLKNTQAEVEVFFPRKISSKDLKDGKIEEEKPAPKKVKKATFEKISKADYIPIEKPIDTAADNENRPFIKEPIPEVQSDKKSRLRQSAVFLILLGVDKAAKVATQFSPDEQHKIFKELQRIGNITEEDINETQAVFGLQTPQDGWGELPTGREFLRTLLQLMFGLSDGSTRFMKLEEEAGVEEYEYLNRLSPVQLKDLLKNESDLVISTVLTLLAPVRSAEILKFLPPKRSVSILQMINGKSKINSDISKMIIGKLNAKAKDICTNSAEIPILGKQRLIDILRNCDQENVQQIIQAVADEDEELAKEIEEKVFTFTDILRLPKKELEKGLKDYPNNEIAFFLKGASDAIKNVFLSCVSQRRAGVIRHEIELLGAVKKSEVLEKRKDFINYLKQLEDEGKIVLCDDEVYVE
ncbi:MAG: hypothetical protein J1G30_01000 [Spirochaetales bacterium]|nr:hypothetical protein [Spirochaetales bacterium]